MNQKQQNDPNDQSEPPRFRISPIWWVVLIALLVWNVITFFSANVTEATIPYSVFLSQVNAGNVANVTISGNQISGQLNNPITYPQPTPGPTPTGDVVQPTPLSYTDFVTLFPDTVGDPTLLPLLEQKGIQVTVQNPSQLLTILLTYGLPLILLFVVIFWVGRQAMQSQQGVFSFGRTRARRVKPDAPKVTFNDVAGADEAKQDLMEVVDFLRKPQKYHDLGARIPRGVLLVGPPGAGKTLLARAVAGEANAPFFSLSASEFVEMFVGVGASRVRDLFEQAKQSAPSIVFIDELDAVGRRRGAGLGAVNDEREQTLNQLLVEMDGFDDRQEVILIAATNRPDVLDPALLRPGRFDRRVVVGAPDRKGRLGIFQIHTRKLPLAEDVNLDVLSTITVGMSGADIANLCNEAALTGARNNHEKISMSDFESALDKITLGAARPLIMREEDRRVIAYHEGGHAVTAWFVPEADTVHKITIIPHGLALGVTEQSPGEDKYNFPRSYLLARLAVMMGGRVGEELAICEISTGAENDLTEATHLARRMVTRWAMTDFGLMSVDTDEEQPFLGYEIAQGRTISEETASKIDEQVQKLLNERHAFTTRILTEHQDALDKLVVELIKRETLLQEEIEVILGPRPGSAKEVIGEAAQTA
jgi:cell division protease FtsH